MHRLPFLPLNNLSTACQRTFSIRALPIGPSLDIWYSIIFTLIFSESILLLLISLHSLYLTLVSFVNVFIIYQNSVKMSLETHCMKAVKTTKFHFFFFEKIKGSNILHIKAVEFLGSFSRYLQYISIHKGKRGGRSTLVVSPGEDNNLRVRFLLNDQRKKWLAIPLQIGSALPKFHNAEY